MNLQAAVKVTAAEWVGPAELCGRVNELVCKNGAVDKFISFFYAVLDPVTRHIQYSNCGHNPPILWHNRGSPDGARSFLESLLRDVGAHCDHQFDDDVTCVVITPTLRAPFKT